MTTSSKVNRPKRSYADGPFGQVHFHDTGGDGQPVVLCHQAPISARQYEAVYPLLAEAGFRAVGIDTPGFGMSDEPDSVPTIEDYATAIPAVLDHLGIAAADVVGHHTGAMIASAFSIQFPDRVRRLILNGPSPFTDEERKEWQAYVDEKEKGFVHKTDGSHMSDLYAGRWAWAEDGTDPALVTRYIVEQLQGYGPFWYGHNAAFAYDQTGALAKITHPTLILINTGDLLYDYAKKTHEIRPDFAYVEIEGGKIDITDQRPTEWVAAVTSFLKG